MKKGFSFILIFVFLTCVNLISAFNFEGDICERDTVQILFGNLTKFTELRDTPSSYIGEGSNCVLVNAGETALEFGACATGTLDGNASSICSDDEVLLGNGTCQTSSDFFDVSGINYTDKTVGAYNDVWISTYNATYVLFNDTDVILSVNTTANIQNLLNGTGIYTIIWDADFNTSLDDRVGSQYNQTDLVLSVNTTNNINNLLSYSINESYYWDTLNTYNATQMEQSGSTLNILVSWFTTQFNALFSGKTTDDLSEGTNKYDNVSWNENHANTLYADINSEGNMSWNQSFATTLYSDIQWGYNMTTATYTLYDSRWLDDTTIGNCSVDGSCSLITYDSELTYTTIWDADFNVSFDDRDQQGSGNASWNQSFADTLYIANNSIGWSLNITKLWSSMFYTPTTSFAWIVDDDGSDLIVDFSSIGGINSLFIETAGTFLEMIANPGPSNDYEMFAFEETQGADTAINFYEGGTGHNRIWNSGSMRIGGGKSSLCSNLTSAVDCNTATTGADLVVQDDGWFGGKLFCSDWSNVSGVDTNWSRAVLNSFNHTTYIWDTVFNTSFDSRLGNLYNQTDLILSVNTTANIQNLLNGTGIYTIIWDADFNTSFSNLDSDTTYSDLSEFNDDIHAGTNHTLHTYTNWNTIWSADDNTQLSEDNVEAFIFDNDNTDNLNMSNYNVTSVDCIVFTNGAQICGV